MPYYHYPSLDTVGWIDTPIKAIDAMVSHFFLSDYSQTACFPGGVSSFAWIVENNQGNVQSTISALQIRLHNYLSKQFPEVTCEIGEIKNETSINKKLLSLYLTVTDQSGETFNMSRVIDYTELTMVKIIDTVNRG